MKQIKNMRQVELAAYIQDYLQAEEIKVVLSGGSAVSFYSSDKYVSRDLDLKEIRRWSKLEGKEREYEIFKRRLS